MCEIRLCTSGLMKAFDRPYGIISAPRRGSIFVQVIFLISDGVRFFYSFIQNWLLPSSCCFFKEKNVFDFFL